MKLSMDTKAGKLVVAGIAVAVVAVVAIVGLVVMRPQQSEEEYRTIRVYRVDGQAEVNRPGVGVSAPYEDMMLQSDDHVTTMVESWLYLLLDQNKYVLAEPQTAFSIQASGTSADSLTHLSLETGALVNHITEPLSDASSYEVSTPNSVMAVRGTSFRVAVTFDKNGVSHTTLQVFAGEVGVRLAYPDGSLSDEERYFRAGQVACIWGNDVTCDYEAAPDEIDFYALADPTLEFLKIGIDKGSDNFVVTVPDVDDIIKLKNSRFTVRFMVDDSVFGTQSVPFDKTATEPLLRPKASGSWDFDFNTHIRKNTDVMWKE